MPAARRCPACTGVLAPWGSAPAAEPGLAPVPMSRCRACGSAVTDAPAQADAHDTGAYASARPRGSRAARPLLDLFDRQRLRLLARHVPPPATLLDVGAGRGRFVANARAAGYAAGGLEPSRRGVEAARAEYGVELDPSPLAQCTARDLDAVTLWHVLEHLDEPLGGLADVRRTLSPRGVLLVGVPDLDALQARVGGDRWYHLDLPRHRIHLTSRGLHVLLRRAGFDVLSTHHLLLEHNPFGMWQSAVNRATSQPSYLFNLLRRNAPLRARDLALTGAAVPLLPVAAAAEAAAALAGRGGTVAVVARRAPSPPERPPTAP